MSKDGDNINELVFISLSPQDYSRSGVFFSGYLGQKSYLEFLPGIKGILLSVRNLKISHNFRNTTIVVMSPSHLLVLYLKLFTRYKIVLDAGWPLSDSEPKVIHPHHYSRDYFRILMIDFFSFKLADLVIFETDKQQEFSRKKFLLRKEKCRSLPTGFNESQFRKAILNPRMPVELSSLKNPPQDFILFRGKYNREAGVEEIVEAARILGSSFKFLFVSDTEIPNIPGNILLINRFVTREELVWIYQNSAIVLGQFGGRNRLSRTAPHKFFEAAYFEKCYVSPRNLGVSGLASEAEVCFVDDSEPKEIAKSIVRLMRNKEELIAFSTNLKNRYELNWSQTKLSQSFAEFIELSPVIN